MYRLSRLAEPPGYGLLTTKDVDLAFSPNAPLAGDIGAALLAAGFEQGFSGEHIPPVTEYRLGSEEQGFFAEFLTPLLGDGVRRDGEDDVTVRIAGITAQKVRHLDLLLISPWAVQVSPALGVPVQRAATLMIPNPVSFIAQKLLIHGRRRPDKRAQGVVYVHDTLELFGRELPTLRATWHERVRPQLPLKTARRIERLSREQYRTTMPVHRSAARIPHDRALTADRLRAATAYGLDQVFGSGAVSQT